MSKYNLTEIFNESFDSLAKKLDKQKGIDKEDAAKIAGSIAAKKMKGAGSGPTAKQKARVKEEEVSDTEQVFDIIYAAGGKDKAPDFMDAIGEEFGIDFEYGRVNEQSKPINELAPDVRNRIEGLISQRSKMTFLLDFIKMYADVTQDDPFDSEDILEYFREIMRRKLKEQDMYEDSFNPDDMKESIKEEEEVVQSPNYEEDKTFLRRTQRIDRYENYDYLIKNKEEYDYIIENGVFAFEDNYDVESDEFEYEDTHENIIETNYSIGNESGLVTQIQEDEEEKEEEIVQYAPFVEGETTLLQSNLYKERYDTGYILKSQEEYDYILKNGVRNFISEYLGTGGIDDYVKDIRFDEKVEFSLGNDIDSYDLTPIQEDLFSKDGDTEDNVDNIDRVSSPSTKGVGYDQVSKANTAEDDMESKETLNPKPMYEDLKKHFKRFM